jgi:hypothetical protein
MKAKKRNTEEVRSVDRKDIKNHKIHSYAVSTPPTGPHRKKIITVRGVPGSAFTLLAQNENNEVYSFQGGGFDRTASSFEGFIPESGVFRAVINTQVSKNVDVRLDSGAGVVDGAKVVQVITGSEGTFSFELVADTTGLSNIDLYDARASFYSPEVQAGSPTGFAFKFTFVSPDSHVINLVKQPGFNFEFSNADNDKGFVLYDGSVYKDDDGEIVNDLAHTVNLDKRAIESDFKYNPILEKSEPNFNVVVESVELYGDTEVAENSIGHSQGFADVVTVRGEVQINSMGSAHTRLRLMAFNFLEVFAK